MKFSKQLIAISSILMVTISGVLGATDLGECFSSRSTWYEAVEHGNCGYGPLEGPTGPGHRFIAAAATAVYNGSSACGECYEINGPMGTQVVTIVDQCPDPGWCDTSFPHFDLSPEAFAVAGGSTVGVFMSTAKKVSCDYVQGPIKLLMKDADTTAQWFEFMVFNHKVGLDHIDIETADGKVISLPRRLYNYWTYSGEQGQVKFPIVARVYSKYGERVDVMVKSFTRAVVTEGTGQFGEPVTGIKDACVAPLPVDAQGWIYHNGSLVKPLDYNHPNLGWADWSSNANINWADTSAAREGGAAVCSATINPIGSIQIGTDLPVEWAPLFDSLEFYIKGDSAISTLAVGYATTVTVPVSTSWTKQTFSLSSLGAPDSLGKPTNLAFRNIGSSAFKIYLDDIKLVPIANTNTSSSS
ncbi:expansin-like protein [Cavenderia fasciculata]|uniref:Expansin-like protein n=1 Tax=Cavenderia fasciculata TaxID=261658 RepID=F4Q1Z1_CACFS|nr:expansin-like protein [Cavenderia fasciculata]EGG18011.1 expansin-like protein [Cavenderia fasciculata]|eukprot:XP_004356904.1 expansin-like protein [Cavenderia fasciculata]